MRFRLSFFIFFMITLCISLPAQLQEMPPLYEQDLYTNPSRTYYRSVKIIRRFVKGKPEKKESEESKLSGGYWLKRKRFNGCTVEDTEIGGIRTQIIRPKTLQSTTAIIYFHGGGYVAGPWRRQFLMMTELAKQTGMTLYVVNYRLAPEHRFPAGLEDCFAVYKALVKEKGAKNLILSGDSAGGGMSMAVTQKAQQESLEVPQKLVLISPWLLVGSRNPEMEAISPIDPLLTYNPNDSTPPAYALPGEFDNPLVSPYYANLEEFPPMLVLIGTWDILWPDCREFLERAKREDADVVAIIGKEMFHVWTIGVGIYKEADYAVSQMAEYILNYEGKAE